MFRSLMAGHRGVNISIPDMTETLHLWFDLTFVKRGHIRKVKLISRAILGTNDFYNIFNNETYI